MAYQSLTGLKVVPDASFANVPNGLSSRPHFSDSSYCTDRSWTLPSRVWFCNVLGPVRCVCVGIAISVHSSASAQVPIASVGGSLRDESGAALSAATTAPRQTDRIENLTPERYEVEVRSAGFKSASADRASRRRRRCARFRGRGRRRRGAGGSRPWRGGGPSTRVQASLEALARGSSSDHSHAIGRHITRHPARDISRNDVDHVVVHARASRVRSLLWQHVHHPEQHDEANVFCASSDRCLVPPILRVWHGMPEVPEILWPYLRHHHLSDWDCSTGV
jgi:hypothetical protein